MRVNMLICKYFVQFILRFDCEVLDDTYNIGDEQTTVRKWESM